MEVKDLRVGNYVHATTAGNQGDGLVVHTIMDGKDIDNAHWYFPIDITEELLVKFGWTKEGKIGWYCKIIGDLKIEIWTPPNNKFYFILGGDNRKVEFKHVHKLQNLCFDITDEELILIK